jgi:two-component system LytT family response regulator
MDNHTSHKPESIQLTFRLAKGWRWLWFTLAGVLLYQFFTLQRPGFGELGPLFKGQLWAYLRALLGYYVLFELISVFVFIRLATVYVRLVGMDRIKLSLSGVLAHQLKFLPFVLLVIGVFGPITNGLRYLAVFYPDYSWTTYFPEYFFTTRMYINYLLPFLIFGYLILNINLFLDYNDWQHHRFVQLNAPERSNGIDTYLKTVEARDEEGETILSVNDVLWFEVEEKSYRAFTRGKTYNIRKTLGELEAELDPTQFFRVNRAVIINLSFLKNYSFWENDKYILRLSDDKTEFIMQRVRLKALKERLVPHPVINT